MMDKSLIDSVSSEGLTWDDLLSTDKYTIAGWKMPDYPIPPGTLYSDGARYILSGPSEGTCSDSTDGGAYYRYDRYCGYDKDGSNDKDNDKDNNNNDKDNERKEEMFDNMFNGICGRIKPGNCRLSYTGGVAVKTSDGTYKTYNMKTGQLTNCDRFVFDVGDDMFMMVPTRKLKRGDIVLFGGQPKCIIEVLPNNHVKVINYSTAVIEEVLPERHVFMGRKFYGKIVSLLGNGFMKEGKGGMFKNLLKFKMMSSMLDSRPDGSKGHFEALPMLFMMGGGSFDGMFDLGDDDEGDDSDDAAEDNVLGDMFDDYNEASEKASAKSRRTRKTKEA